MTSTVYPQHSWVGRLQFPAVCARVGFTRRSRALNRSQETVRQSLIFLAEKGRVTDDELGAMLGKTRQTGWAKRNGGKHGSRITFDDIDLFSEAMGVDKSVFLMERDELERWYERSKWRGPKRPVTVGVPCDHPKRSTACRYGTMLEDPLPFGPDDPNIVIDLRDHRVTEINQDESPDLLLVAV